LFQINGKVFILQKFIICGGPQLRQRDELLNRELKVLKKETKERRDRLVLSIQATQLG
jgi:hypothetical protein